MECMARGKSPAWFADTREAFLSLSDDAITNQLAGRAASESLEIEAAQSEEWKKSISLLQNALGDRIPILREALAAESGKSITHVILEYDFRRRGLRMDCLLLGHGLLFVTEFKRNKPQGADRDQVMTYAVNLLEFHEETQSICNGDTGALVVPVLVQTEGKHRRPLAWPGHGETSWNALVNAPLECDGHSLAETLKLAYEKRRSSKLVNFDRWIASSFKPSSSILDATLSLYGNHDVSAIQEHAAPKEQIQSATDEIRSIIERSLQNGEYRVVFLSGAPGAGKTLVGLDLVMRGEHAENAVFVTGNTPLVDVLTKALRGSFRSQSRSQSKWAPTGYRHKDAALVADASTYKLVKAHRFLGQRGTKHQQTDGRVLVFDEAQRTYEKGRVVLREKLSDHEADLILEAQRRSFPSGGSVVVALVGHNQAINRGEMGIRAWLEAIERKGWSFSISKETLALAEITDRSKWEKHPKRSVMQTGHLSSSMRYYRNERLEEWVDAVLSCRSKDAKRIAAEMQEKGHTVWITRSLSTAKEWARKQCVGGLRSGIIASGQAKRLAAEGLFVDFKPDIATWMLAPTSDIRSSNALEVVQNQYQVQGLELDFCIVCWDADLRHYNDEWKAYKISGSSWANDKLLEVAKNGYRVILTRARKGLVIFIPSGNLHGNDSTRAPQFYDDTYRFLVRCGAVDLGKQSCSSAG
jgi:hypothetical protein